MKINVQQTIQIRMIKIGGISNASVFQIGTTGIIKPAAYLYNTGCFTEPAPIISAAQGIEGIPPIVVPFRNDGSIS